MTRELLEASDLIHLWKFINGKRNVDQFRNKGFPIVYHLKECDFKRSTSLLPYLHEFYGEQIEVTRLYDDCEEYLPEIEQVAIKIGLGSIRRENLFPKYNKYKKKIENFFTYSELDGCLHFKENVHPTDIISLDKKGVPENLINILFDSYDKFVRALVVDIKDNIAKRKPLFDGRPVQDMYKDFYSKKISIQCEEQEFTKDKMQEWLDEYLKDFEDGQLSFDNDYILYNLEAHFNRFMGLIGELLQRANTKGIPITIGINVGDFNYKYRDIEYILVLEKRGFIKIHELGIKDKNSVFVRIDILKEFNEIHDLYNNWITFSNLSLRPDSGHAINGELASKPFTKDKPAYNALKYLLENPTRKVTHIELEAIAYGENDILDTNIKRKEKLNNLIDKQIRKPLKLTNPKSRVNILGADGCFFLSAIPNR